MLPGAPPAQAAPPGVPATTSGPPPKKRRRIGWIITVVLLALALIAVGTLFVLTYLRLEEAKTVIDQQTDLIDEKETFGEAMSALVEKTVEFEGLRFGDLIPWADYQRMADTAYAQRWDVDAMRAKTDQAVDATAELDALLVAATEQAATNATKSTYEKTIDALGDGFVVSLLDNADKLCGDDVLGCVSGDDPYTIHFDKADAAEPFMTPFIQQGIAYHEYAHVLQFTNLEATEIALESFKGDPETMADCFALTYLKGWTLDHEVPVDQYSYYEVSIGYGYTCNSKQKQAVRDWYDSLKIAPRSISQ